GIILEDDCVPHPDFFTFCSSLLEFYRNDERVWVITGDNFQNGQKRGDGYYYFSKYNHCWGWATWHRAWKHYQGDIPFWTEWQDSESWSRVLPNTLERRYWAKIFNTVYSGKIDSWAYPWTACVWYHGGLTLTPNRNLVTNIGFGKDATHTTGRGDKFNIISTETLSLSSLSHPVGVFVDQDADNYVFENVFRTKYQGIKGILTRIVLKVQSIYTRCINNIYH
ncbi:glycosyltransferase family 2 protein, partial [Raphidiopsis sp. BLCC-F218]